MTTCPAWIEIDYWSLSAPRDERLFQYILIILEGKLSTGQPHSYSSHRNPLHKAPSQHQKRETDGHQQRRQAATISDGIG